MACFYRTSFRLWFHKRIFSNAIRLYVTNNQEIDILDDFTSRLIQQKSSKWDTFKIGKKNLFNLVDMNDSNVNITNIKKLRQKNDREMDLFLIDYINKNDQLDIQEFEKGKNYFQSLIHLISTCGYYGEKELVLKLIEYGVKNKILDNRSSVYCQQYVAEALWIQGNVQESIKVFRKLYISHAYLRPNISLLLRFLIGRTTELRTEAILVQITKFVEELSIFNNDYGPFNCLWEVCFLSEWFCDQSASLEMLEHNTALRQQLSTKYNLVIIKALHRHRVEVVQRLFEMFLRLKMDEQYIPALRMLFDYYYYQKDFRHCAEIIHWSTNFNIPLRTEQNTKFLTLLLDQYGEKNGDKPPVQKEAEKLITTPQFKLKF